MPRSFEELSDEQAATLLEQFSFFDKDGDGDITAEELGQVMRALGQDPTDAELRAMIDAADTDGNGVIDFPEFLLMMSRMMPGTDDEAETREVFDEFDADRDGFINNAELAVALRNREPALTEAEAERLVREADIDGDGRVDFSEFVLMMRNG